MSLSTKVLFYCFSSLLLLPCQKTLVFRLNLNTRVLRHRNNNSQEKTKNKTLVDRKQLFTNFLHFFTDFFRTALLCELFIIPIILVWILLVHKRTMPFTEDHKSIHRSSNFILIFLVTIFCQIILVFVVWIFSRFFFRIMILMVVMMMMSSFGSTSRWRRLPGWWFSLG